jgi:hypothetical protein
MCLKLFEYDVLLLPFEKNNDIFISLNQKVKINFDFDKKDFVKNLHNKIINECNIKYNVHNFNFKIIDTCFILIQAVDNPNKINNNIDMYLCGICMENKKNCVIQCGHVFCNKCIDNIRNINNKCPICIKKIDNVTCIFL